jgi:hypothetical protein
VALASRSLGLAISRIMAASQFQRAPKFAYCSERGRDQKKAHFNRV